MLPSPLHPPSLPPRRRPFYEGEGEIAMVVFHPLVASASWRISVAIGGVPVFGSPFRCRVRPGPAVAACCELLGEWVHSRTGVAGASHEGVLQLRDGVANRCEQGGVLVEAQLSPAGEGDGGR